MPEFDPSKYRGMSMDDVLGIADRSVAAGASSLEEARAIYKLCLEQNIGIYHKGVILQKLWDAECKLGLHPLFQSQAGQDFFLHRHFFTGKKDGVFVEIGGYNGWQGSNCFFFEKTQNWTGLIVEASPTFVRQISDTRTAPVVHAAVSDEDGTAEFLEVTSGFMQMSGLTGHFTSRNFDFLRRDSRHTERKVVVPTVRLDTLLEKHGIGNVDYCSIDVEGAERSILSALDFDLVDISVLSVENNSYSEAGSYVDILEPAGFRLVVVLGSDEIWAKAALADAAGL